MESLDLPGITGALRETYVQGFEFFTDHQVSSSIEIPEIKEGCMLASCFEREREREWLPTSPVKTYETGVDGRSKSGIVC
jgi:hypothetical protein